MGRLLLPHQHEISGVIDPADNSADNALADTGPRDRSPVRRCIVTRQSRPIEDLIRFARSPDGDVVPDLRQRLPGRGVWVSGKRETVAEAVQKKSFGRAFRADSRAPADLADMVGKLIRKAALERLGLERKAGRLLIGFAEVDSILRRGHAALVLHAADAAADGLRKLNQAAYAGGGSPYVCRAFTSAEMSLALGRGNVIHAALEKSGATSAVISRCRRVEHYFGDFEPASRAEPDEFAGRIE